MKHAMIKYTVIVGRPSGQHEDVYVAHVRARTATQAEEEGVKQCFHADVADAEDNGDDAPEESGYEAIVTFDGHLDVVKWGWQ